MTTGGDFIVMDNLVNIIAFVGGLGMFLYGMHIMADGMQKTAGSRMKKFLGMLTNNRVMGILLGALITAIIQSSGATTVMVIGFVSAGVLSLGQAVGVIMGANIGTTITAWIVSVSQIGGALEFAKPEFYAPLLIGIGAILIVFTKSDKKKNAGEIVVGLGLLFLGLKAMSGAISPYADSPVFAKAFLLLGSNPILGIIVGCIVTAAIQSSSVSVGILQTLAMNGMVTTNAAIYITLGQNIGSCVTALIAGSGAGSSRTAKRAAIIHLTFNVIGAILFGIGGFIFFSLNQQIASHHITSVEISLFHTGFNLVMTCILFPFADKLVELSGIIIKDRPQKAIEESDDEVSAVVKRLDNRILSTPAFAVETVVQEVIHMGNMVLSNVKEALDASIECDVAKAREVIDSESKCRSMQNLLTDYLIKVDKLSLSDDQKMTITNLFYSVTDIERAEVHAKSIAQNILYMNERDLVFSDLAKNDLRSINSHVYDTFEYAIEARKSGSMSDVRKSSQAEDEVVNLLDELREKHIERLSDGSCTPAAGIIFLDILSNIERIGDHADNLAGYIKKEL